MSSETHGVTLPRAVWRAVETQAKSEGMEVEAWIERAIVSALPRPVANVLKKESDTRTRSND